MNIAFPAILLLAILLPGFIFRSSYNYFEHTDLNFNPFTYKTLFSLSVAICIHIVALLIVYIFFNYKVNFYYLLVLLSSQNEAAVNEALNNFKVFQTQIISYFLAIWFFSWIGGHIFREILKRTGLDKRYKFLRPDNKWYYIFQGYDNDDPSIIGQCAIIALIESAGKNYLYIGFLTKYYFDKNGKLDELLITNAHRRLIEADKPKYSNSSIDNTSDNEATINDLDIADFEERFYPIDGDVLILKYDQIINLNIYFLRGSKEKNK